MASVIEGTAVDNSYELNISLAAISNRWFSNENPSLVALALQSGETLGAQAMELLLRRIKQTDTGPMRSVVVPMEIHRLI